MGIPMPFKAEVLIQIYLRSGGVPTPFKVEVIIPIYLGSGSGPAALPEALGIMYVV